jgi:hypothetical protein
MAVPFILYSCIDTTPAATSEAAGYDVENIVDWRAYTRWRATGTGTQYITFDAGSPVSVDAIGIEGHNIAGATVSVEWSTDNSNWTEVLAGFTATAGTILKSWTAASKRYWRIKIASASVAPEIGVVSIGARMDFPHYPDAPLDFISESPQRAESVSKTGHLLGVVTRYRPYTFSMQFSDALYTWVTANFDTFWEAHCSLHKPFFVMCNDAPRFCRFPESFEYRKQLNNSTYMDLSLKFEGVL